MQYVAPGKDLMHGVEMRLHRFYERYPRLGIANVLLFYRIKVIEQLETAHAHFDNGVLR